MCTHSRHPQQKDPIAEAVREINRCGGAILTLSTLVGDGQEELPAREVGGVSDLLYIIGEAAVPGRVVGGVSDLLHIVGEAIYAATHKIEQAIERGGRP